jgi:hypothetical protein
MTHLRQRMQEEIEPLSLRSGSAFCTVKSVPRKSAIRELAVIVPRHSDIIAVEGQMALRHLPWTNQPQSTLGTPYPLWK